MRPALKNIFVLGGFLAAAFLAAAIGSLFTGVVRSDWYVQLAKPSFNPPSWVFGPVWTALYTLMAVAAWLVWRRHGLDGAPTAMLLWAGQLAVNAAWSPVFFGLRSPGGGVLVIAILLVLVVLTTVWFWRARPAAGLLMLPYVAWVAFASVLNVTIWWLGRVQ